MHFTDSDTPSPWEEKAEEEEEEEEEQLEKDVEEIRLRKVEF